jgi:tetratricopeptide (TPR) repeat protein
MSVSNIINNISFKLNPERGFGLLVSSRNETKSENAAVISGCKARIAGALYKESIRYYRKKHYPEALRKVQESIQLNPHLEKAYLLQGRINLKMGDRTSVVRCYEKYLEYKPDESTILDFLIKYYSENKCFKSAGITLEKRASLEKKKDISVRILHLAGRMYLMDKDCENALRVYNILAEKEPHNSEIYQRLKTIYHRLGEYEKWKTCREVLLLNKMITKELQADSERIFKTSHPLTPELHEKIMHPNEVNFRTYFSWILPLFKMMERSTPQEILRSSEDVSEGEIYSLYRECCMFLNMEPPPLRCYRGKARFKFLADPVEHSDKYTLIYNEEFINYLDDAELAFLFINQLSLIKSNFVALLNLSLSDFAKLLLEAASLVFGVLAILKSVPVNKVSKVIGKFVHSKHFIEKIIKFQRKISKLEIAGRSPGEMQKLIRVSIDRIPDKIRSNGEIDTDSPFNRRFLESALMSFYNTADRTAYYFTRDHIAAASALLKLTESENTFERVKRFGLQAYLAETKEYFLKERLGNLFVFSVNSELFDNKPK